MWMHSSHHTTPLSPGVLLHSGDSSSGGLTSPRERLTQPAGPKTNQPSDTYTAPSAPSHMHRVNVHFSVCIFHTAPN